MELQSTRTTQRHCISPSLSPTTLGVSGLAAFALMVALVQLRLVTGMDYVIARSMQYVGTPILDWWASVAGTLASAELAMVYAAILALILWRKGAGLWALAPFAFLAPTGIEMILKAWLPQPPIPAYLHFHVQASNNLPTVVLSGSFPSGHSIRSAFFGTFLSILLWRRKLPLAGILTVVSLAFGPVVGLAMVYAAWHWMSDVIAGLLLGSSVALLIAPRVAQTVLSSPPAPER